MTEWNGDPLWWQDGVQLLVNALEASASPISPPPDSNTRATIVTPVMSCDGTSATNARLSHVAVDGRSTPCSSSTGAHAKAAHNSKKEIHGPPSKQQPWFEFLPLQTSLKPTLRPKFIRSQKNVASMDRQAAKEEQIAQAKAARYLKLAASNPSHNHHHVLQLGTVGATPQEHVVPGDRGKHRPAWCRSGMLFDPITSTSRPVTAPGRSESRAGLLSPDKSRAFSNASQLLLDTASTPESSPPTTGITQSILNPQVDRTVNTASSVPEPSSPASVPTHPRRPGSACGAPYLGRYDPLTHTWLTTPDTAVYERWQRDTGTATSFTGRRPMSAGGSSGGDVDWANRDTVGSLLRQHSSNSTAGPVLYKGGASPSGSKKHLQAGDTWGTYDCLRNRWVVPPHDERYVNREMGPGSYRAEPLPGTAPIRPLRKGATPPSTGIYDPIKGEWKVLPQQQRLATGLDFAPTKLFQQAAFVKR